MKFNVKVRKIIENGKPLKATCSVTMDDQFTIHGVKVITTEKHTFIAMPSESYDKLELYGGRARWPDVLSVYSVKTTSDTENGQEVATMDEDKLEILRNIFWDVARDFFC